MANTIYTLGYSGVPIDQIRRALSTLDAVFVDTRYSPFSREVTFQKAALEGALGDRYVHCRGFGNVNYRAGDDAPVRLADPEHALRQMEALVSPKNPLLVCACWSFMNCHRKDVAEWLAARLGWPIRHLTKRDLVEMWNPQTDLLP
jgi:uncharacterized protein (DUF488 family)